MSAPSKLTPAQHAAVEADARVTLLLAPAGSGKTEVLIRRIIRILSESEGESFRVLAVTFTLKAADELRQRVKGSVGEEEWRVDADTIHGLALEWLRRYGEDVGVPPDVVVYSDDTDRARILRRYVESIGDPIPGPPELREVLARIDDFRTRLLPHPDIPNDPLTSTNLGLREIYDAYVVALESEGGIDFPGMLTKFVELTEQDPSVVRRFRRTYRHVLVDEAQDLTKAQSELLRRLVGDSLSLFLVADERQSILGWAGGGIKWARALAGQAATELTLDHNFRSATTILDTARTLAQHLRSRPGEIEAPVGTPAGTVAFEVAEDEDEEAVIVANWLEAILRDGLDPHTLVPGESPDVDPEETAIIARSRYALDATQAEFARRNRPVSISANVDNLLATSEGRLLHALLELKVNPHDRPALRRVDEELASLLPTRMAGQGNTKSEELTFNDITTAVQHTPIASLVQAAVDCEDTADGLDVFVDSIADSVSLDSPEWLSDAQNLRTWWHQYRASTRSHQRNLKGFLRHLFRVQRTRPDDPGVRLLTAHRAKGLEFKAVAIVGLTQGVFPDFRNLKSPTALDEERRVFYVSLTRARRALLLTWPQVRRSRYGQQFVTDPSQFLAEAALLDVKS